MESESEFNRNNLYKKSLDFGIEIVLLTRRIKGNTEKEIVNQILRAGTSVGANVAEAQGSLSGSDYISKILMAQKELIETKFWVDLLLSIKDIEEKDYNSIIAKYNEISKILYTIIKNIRAKKY